MPGAASAKLRQRVPVVLVVVLLVEPVTPPDEPELESDELGGEPIVPELELPLLPGPPMELVLPLLPLPLVLGVVPAVLPDPPVPEPMLLPEGLVPLDELVEPGAPVGPVAVRLSHAPSARAATTAKVAAAH